MLLSPIIQRLRNLMPSQFKVGGAADLEQYNNTNLNLPMPAIYAVYAGSRAYNSQSDPLYAEIDERLQIYSILDNSTDRTGKNAQEQIHSLRTALFKVLLNYQADSKYSPLQFESDKSVSSNAAQYMHVFEFKQTWILEQCDGVDPDISDLNSIFIDWDLKESPPINYPNAQNQITNLQD